MALRTTYPLNMQKANWSNIPLLTPLGYLEVAPSDTIQGTIQIRTRSAPLVRETLNRTYMDAYAFYCPFRLLWDGWPDWITNGVGTLPTVSNAWEFNMEHRLTDASGGAGTAANRNTAWMRYMYNTVYNKFFLKDSENPVTLTDTNPLACYQRPSTFETAEPVKAVSAQTAASLDVDDIREAFAKDAFNRLRGFYGNRYTDYLRSTGVQDTWTLAEEPEVIGRKSSDWKARIITLTDTTSAGQPVGVLDSTINLGIRRTFCPEHGIIGVFTVARTDPLFSDAPCNPMLAKMNREMYWSPEYGMEREELWPDRLLNTAATVTYDLNRPKFEDYRKGLNENRTTTALQAVVPGTYATVALDQYSSGAFSGLFDTTIIPSGLEYTALSQWRLKRSSAIQKAGAMPPIR